MDAETDQGKWFQKIHCLFFSSVSWKNCPTTCGLRKFSYGAHIVNQNPSNPKFLCVLFPSLHWICSVCFKWLSADFDRLIQKKNAETTMRGYQKELSRKIVVNWAAEPYTLKAFDTYPLACFYLRTPKEKRTGRVVDRSCWNNPRPR
jgi:hypothetical protein